MNGYRTLLWWLALALLGALCWDWLATDPGELIIRLRGQTVTTSVAFALFAWALLWFALWALWWLLRLPLRAWRRHRQRQARKRLLSGLEALHQGRWSRAEALLEKAAEESDVRTTALLGARRAAEARDDQEAIARWQAALLAHDPHAAALDQAERLLAAQRPADALSALTAIPEGNLPPRGVRLQVEALIATGRAAEAGPALNTLRREQALPAPALAALELRIAAASLSAAASADVLRTRWHELARRLQEHPAVAAAYAQRAAALGLEDDGAQALAQSLDAHWDEAAVDLFSRLPAGPGAMRLASAEGWLASHANSPTVLLALGRLCRNLQLWGKAEDYLHRALAQGAGSHAWEALGDVFTAQNDAPRAQLAYANALRVGRGEPALTLGGRALRDQIADQAVAEQRNEHGLPLLPR